MYLGFFLQNLKTTILSFSVVENSTKMAGPVKTVCFIASAIIAWGLFVIGEPIVAWFDYKINGTEIPYFGPMKGLCQAISYHMSSIVIHGLLLHGIRKETTKAMFPWMCLYFIFMFAGLCVILTTMTPISSYPPIVSTNIFYQSNSSNENNNQ